jgi:hypothetical protein
MIPLSGFGGTMDGGDEAIDITRTLRGHFETFEDAIKVFWSEDSGWHDG